MSKRDGFDRFMMLVLGTAMWTCTFSDKPTLESCSETAKLSFLPGSLSLLVLGLSIVVYYGSLLAEKWPLRSLGVVIGIIPLFWLMTWDKDCARSSISFSEFFILYTFASIPPFIGEIGRWILRKFRGLRKSNETTMSETS
ncbi:MAG: hypothetical protein CBB60_010425 [Armatimonadetes bacterium Cent15-Ar3]|nr:MAG: hypothetical protein CBB60_010425 [Armatimonadetes bacterium Cent15-Ar3]